MSENDLIEYLAKEVKLFTELTGDPPAKPSAYSERIWREIVREIIEKAPNKGYMFTRAEDARGWLPIESAPKDAPFLGAVYHGAGEWEVLRMEWVDWASRFGDATYHPFIADQVQPTFWQPLPAPPL